MIRKVSNAILVVALSVLAPVAYGSGTESPASSIDSNTQRMVKEIRKNIVTLSNYGVFDNITFALNGDGAVVLKGYASRPTLKSSAEKVVKKITGVTSVENLIEVLPNSRFDERIRGAVYASIYAHPSLSRYNPGRGVPVYYSPARAAFGPSVDPPIGAHPIHIIVKNGVVMLEGVVDTTGDRNIAFIQANSTSNVFEVINNLVVPGELNKGKASSD